MGQTQVSLLRIKQQTDNLLQYEDNLHKEFFEIQEDEKSFIESVTEKYGEGELNPNTGTFIPQKNTKK